MNYNDFLHLLNVVDYLNEFFSFQEYPKNYGHNNHNSLFKVNCFINI